MLEEDLEEERFFAAVRRAYWAAPDGSPTRALCEHLTSGWTLTRPTPDSRLPT